MICTSKQLKDKVRNISKGDNNIAKTLIRNFFMERFLERMSLSIYRNKFILKGGMLVASIIGVNARATMDIDTTVKSITLNEENIRKIISEICTILIEDGVSFNITSISNIMADFEYPGIRITLEAFLDRMRQTIKLDISTDDVITPSAVEYSYKLMFEDRNILLFTYNKETLLAEKMQTILIRGISNTRLRDFYDVYIISKTAMNEIDKILLAKAFQATCQKRETLFSAEEILNILDKIKENDNMVQMWEQFKKKNYFAGDLNWNCVLNDVIQMINTYII